jgi:undecaprenyl-diphosphatase
VAWPLGISIAATRILLLAHWTTDVIAGLALGVMIERSVWPLWRRLIKRIERAE